MAFKFIIGPSDSDKTSVCMDIIEKSLANYNNIYYFVPEYLSFTAEKMVSEKFGSVSEAKVNVTSFKKLYCETVNIFGEKNVKKLTPGGMGVLMAYICHKTKKEMSMMGKAAQTVGFAEIMLNAVREFKTYNISPQDLVSAAESISDSLKLKLQDISKIYEEYNSFLEKGFSDAQDELAILEKTIIENPGYFSQSLFVFDGFSMFTPDQLSVVAVLAHKSDIAFAITTDGFDGETYAAQKRCIENIRKTLQDVEELPPEVARERMDITSFPEGKYILNALLYGNIQQFEYKPDNIEIHEFAEQYQETEYVAEKIINLVKSGVRYKDIMIIARDSDRYLPVIASVFKNYDIPVFVDNKLGAANQPAINAVISALNVIQENYTYESVFSYLKSGFSNLTEFETDLVENYILATGIRGKSWMKKWEYKPYISGLIDDEEKFLETINQIREKVVSPLVKLKNGLDTQETIKGKCKVLFEFIDEIGLFDKIGGIVERFKESDSQVAAYCSKVWNLLIGTLDNLVELIGDEKETTELFLNLFTVGVSSQEISIVPTSVDVVQVVVPENISENPEKYVFVIGANDGVYPTVMQNEGILSDRDRGILESLGVELAEDTVSKAIEENYITLKVFLSANKKLYISYPVGDTAGGARFPSVAVKRIESVFPMLEINSHTVSSENYSDDKIIKPKPAFEKFAYNLRTGNNLSDKWNQAGVWFRESDEWRNKYNLLQKAINFSPKTQNLDGRIIDRLYEKGLNLSISSMEQYSKCPFAYYANYTLKLKPREKVEFSNADSGSLMHEAIEKLSGSIIKNGYSWRSVPQEFLKRQTVKIADEIIIELEGKFDYTSVSQVRKLARIKEMLEQSVLYIAAHLKAGQFEPIGYEIEFGTGKNYEAVKFEIAGKKVRLRGKVDRADIYCDEQGRKYIRVIDYKSGEKNFDFSAMLYGLQMQLVVYIDALCEETGANPAGILYFRLFDPVVDASQSASEDEITGLIEKEHKMSGVVLDNDEIIKAMDTGVTSDSKIIPVKFKINGEVDKRSSVLTSSQFSDMQKHINRLVKQVGKNIIYGKVDVSPILFGSTTACDYCDFKKICLFDEHCGGRYKELENLKKDEVLFLIKKAGEEDDQTNR